MLRPQDLYEDDFAIRTVKVTYVWSPVLDVVRQKFPGMQDYGSIVLHNSHISFRSTIIAVVSYPCCLWVLWKTTHCTG